MSRIRSRIALAGVVMLAAMSAEMSAARAAEVTFSYTVPAGGFALADLSAANVLTSPSAVLASFTTVPQAQVVGFSYTGLTATTEGDTWGSDLRLGFLGRVEEAPDVIGLFPFDNDDTGPAGPVNNVLNLRTANPRFYVNTSGVLSLVAYSTYITPDPVGRLTGGTITITVDTDVIEPPPLPQFTTAFAGSNVGEPTFNRATAGGTSLSSIGTAVAYDVIPFYVPVGGVYQVEIVPDADLDAIGFVYAGSFNPAAALANFVGGGDVGFEGEPDLIEDLDLVPGTQYFLVVAGFDNANTEFGVGTFTGGITGPGTATLGLIPEPSMVGLFVLAVPFLSRRRVA